MKICKLVLIILLYQTALFGQVSLKTGVSKSTINIGDYITYYIIINYSRDIKLILPPPAKELGGFDIKDYNIIDEKSKDKKTQIRRIEYTITTYFLGDFEIPSIEIKYEDKNNNAGATLTNRGLIKTEPLLIKVVPIKRLPTDKDDIRDIKKQEYIKNYIWIYMLIILLLIGAGIYFYLYYKKYLKKEVILPGHEKKEIIIPEDIMALEKIKELQKKGYIENKLVKLFYFELCEIIREYLAGRFNIFTLERTTYEIMLDLRKILEDKKIQQFINDFFIDSDMVKFAKYQPTANEINGIVDRAVQLITITKKESQTNEDV